MELFNISNSDANSSKSSGGEGVAAKGILEQTDYKENHRLLHVRNNIDRLGTSVRSSLRTRN
jgi:hypothetical protein